MESSGGWRRGGSMRSLNSRCSSSLHLTPNETRSRNAPEDRGQVYVGGGECVRARACVSERERERDPSDRGIEGEDVWFSED